MELQGKTVLLTGASKGLGHALARGLDQLGCRLILVARDEAKLEALIAGLQTPGSRALPCDLGDPGARHRLLDRLRAEEVRLDLLILNAGMGSHSRLEQLCAEEVGEVLQLNTVAPLELTAELLPLLPTNEPAGIVLIGSVAGELQVPGMSLYSASKAALHAFGQAAEMELAAGTHFCLLVILGVISGTNFRENIRHPRAGGSGWYHRLDVEADDAAAAIIRAIAAERTRLVIPGWYGPLIRLNHLLSPVTKAAVRLAKRKV